MFRFLFVVALCMSFVISSYAGKRAPVRLIRMGEQLLNQSHNDSIYFLGKYFVEKYPEDPETKWIIWSAATTATYLADYVWAEKAFKVLLHTPDPKMEEDFFQPKGYSFFKSYACMGLARLYFTKGRYKQALEYLKLSDNKYPEYYSCGNAAEIEESHQNIMYATCYEQLGQPDSAINVLLPYMFDYNWWLKNETARKELVRLLKIKYPFAILSMELQKAALTISVIKDNKAGHIPWITIFGKKIKMAYAPSAMTEDERNGEEFPPSKLKEVYKEVYT